MQPCESLLELDYLYHLEFDDQVADYDMQPIWIPFININGKKTKYPPDIKVNYTKAGKLEKGFPYSIIEIKFKEELEQKEEEYKPKFLAVEQYCTENNCGFEIVDESQIRTSILKNYKFFYRYLPTQSLPKVPTDVLQLAKQLVSFSGFEFLDKIDGNMLVKGQTLHNLWHHVANRNLFIDWHSPINMNTVIKTK